MLLVLDKLIFDIVLVDYICVGMLMVVVVFMVE